MSIYDLKYFTVHSMTGSPLYFTNSLDSLYIQINSKYFTGKLRKILFHP